MDRDGGYGSLEPTELGSEKSNFRSKGGGFSNNVQVYVHTGHVVVVGVCVCACKYVLLSSCLLLLLLKLPTTTRL